MKARHKGHIAYDSFSMKCPEYVNPEQQRADYWLPGEGEKGQWGRDCLMGTRSFLGVMKVLKLERGGDCITL